MYDPLFVRLLDALNLAVLEHVESRSFKLLSAKLYWLPFLFPDFIDGNDVASLDELDYLGNFITDAIAFWQAGDSAKLDSGIWSEVGPSGDVYWFEASALNLDAKRILIVKTHGREFAPAQMREQAAKDNLLAFENLFRTEKDLEKYSNLLEAEVNKRTADLRKRVRELNCLYGISRIIGEKISSLETIYKDVVNLIPDGFQYPDITCVQLTIGDNTYSTPNWQETSRKLDNIITSQGKEVGHLEVCYIEERPERDEGPFLQEERSLLTAICERLSKVITRYAAEKAAKESQERYTALFDRSLEIVYIHDFNGNFLDANSMALESLGYTREEIKSLNIASFIDQEQLPEALNRLDNLYRTGIQDELAEHSLKCKDGHYIDVEIRSSLIYHEGKPYAVQGMARDITEKKRTQENLQQSYQVLNKTFDDTILAFSTIVEIKDRYTAGHQIRVAKIAEAIAREMNQDEEQVRVTRIAGIIHDIGKIYVPADILSRPGRLNDLEFEIIKTHAQYGYDILKTIDFPWPIAQVVLQHHEKLDGSGYPNGIKGKDILLYTRILTVADVVEAMASHRPYRSALGLDKALEEISRNKGKLYDPDVVDACVKLFTEKDFKLEE
jgi:PAS domain S-box-containing protein/putative nucleotidyltransferase with HDIG domain